MTSAFTRHPALLRMREQIRANPRLQVGLAVIGLILLCWLVLVTSDARQALVRDLAGRHERLAQIKQLAGQRVWIQRAVEAETLARTLEAEIPAADSAGMAQAAFQSWLRPIVEPYGSDVRLEVQTPVMVDSPAGTAQVTAVISGSLPPQRVIQLVSRIEAARALVVVPLATIRDDGANRTFSLTVRAYYRIAPEGPQT